MTTVNKNPVLHGIVSGEGLLQHQSVPCSNTTAPFHQGDLLYWDSSAHLAKPVDSDANAAYLIGVALKASIVNSNLDNTAVGEPCVNTGYGVVAPFKTTAGQTLNHGDLVYIGADAQTITNATGNSYAVGSVSLPPGGSAISGATGVLAPVLVYSRSFVKLAN